MDFCFFHVQDVFGKLVTGKHEGTMHVSAAQPAITLTFMGNDAPKKISPEGLLANNWITDGDELSLKRGNAKTAEASRGLVSKPALEENCDEMGHVEAGHLLKLIDVVGAVPAFRHVDGQNMFVTASMDRTNFVNPIKAWDWILMESRLTKVFTHSAEVQVKVSAVGYRHGKPSVVPVATAHLVYAALDKNRQKVKIPPLVAASVDDYQLAHAAEVRRSNRKKEFHEAPYVSLEESDLPRVSEIVREITQNETNIAGSVFGGVTLEVIEQAAKKAAKKQANGDVVTGVRMDRMNFIAPGYKGETIRARAIVTKTWTTSMEVQVELEAIRPDQPDNPRKIADCYLVYVRLGENGKPVEVPEWVPQTEAQENRASAADVRRSIREQEEEDIDRQKSDLSIGAGQRFMLFWRDKWERVKKSWHVLTK